jgi:hypothetical protein
VEVMIANAGIEFTLDQPSLMVGALNDIDLNLMTDCATAFPHWRFPGWFVRLARDFSDDVDKALAESLESQWQFDSDRTNCLEKLTEFELGPKVQRLLIEKLASSACRCEDSKQILEILLKCDQLPTADLSGLARRNLELSSGDVTLDGMWLATWLSIDVDDAIQYWENSLRSRADAVSLLSHASAELLTQLRHGKRGVSSAAELRRMILLTLPNGTTSDGNATHRAVGASELSDGELRQSNALEFHNTLWQCLAEDPTPEATKILDGFVSDDQFKRIRTRIIRLRNDQSTRRAELPAWRPEDIRHFENLEVNPRNDHDLFMIAVRRLTDIKSDVERSDTGLRTHLRHGDPEKHLRTWLGHELTLRANGRYVVSQEAVIDREQRPDLTLQHSEAGSIWLEIKWAHTWSFVELLKGLEAQLLGKYLRGHRSNCGIYVLATFEQRTWKAADYEPKLRFDELVETLQKRAEDLVKSETSPVKHLAVIGISFLA